VINVVVSLSNRRVPGEVTKVSVQEHRDFNKYIFVVATFTILTSLSLLS